MMRLLLVALALNCSATRLIADRVPAFPGAGDADGDGYTNLEEFLNATDPRFGKTGNATREPAGANRFWDNERAEWA